MTEVAVQEIEVRLRQFKEEWDLFSTKEQEGKNLKKIADNTGSIIVSMMEKAGLDKVKTAYGTAILSEGALRLNNHAATLKPKPKKSR